MARAIDGELLELEIANIANKLAKSDAVSYTHLTLPTT